MAGDYILPEETMSAAPGRFEKLLKTFIVLAVLALGAELVWLFGITPFRPFVRIDIVSHAGLAREEIFRIAGIKESSSYFSTDVRAMEKALAGVSALETARVYKHFPDRLRIVLEGRRAVASALVSMDGSTVPVLFDSNGVIFRVGADENSLSGNDGLPLISGLVIEKPFAGMKLPLVFVPFFKELEKIQISAPELLTAVSELRISSKSYEGYDLVLYPVHKKVRVRLSELNEDLLRYTLLMVDVLVANEPGTKDLDFRSGIASYIPKEASSE